MSNKYLTKIAKTDIAASGTGLDNTEKTPRATLKEPVKTELTEKTAGLKDWYKTLDTTDKVKLGMSATGLSLGTAGFMMNQHRLKQDAKRRDMEAQSLATLKKIHESLAAKDKPE